MGKGYVYIASNPIKGKNIYIIGRTSLDDPAIRIKNLSKGQHEPFLSHAFFLVQNHVYTDFKLKQYLKKFCLSQSREYFKIPFQKLIQQLENYFDKTFTYSEMGLGPNDINSIINDFTKDEKQKLAQLYTIESKIITIVLLTFFFPIGLICMWIYKPFNLKIRLVISLIFIIYLFLIYR